MPINPDAVGAKGEARRATWNADHCLLYALGVGAGMEDPVGSELEFTTENSKDVQQRALPTTAVVLAPIGAIGAIGAPTGLFLSAFFEIRGQPALRIFHHHFLNFPQLSFSNQFPCFFHQWIAGIIVGEHKEQA